jgi:ferrous iron transport protein B
VKRRIALAGNPNTGKSTLFNRLTGAQARVGNYPGVTVELAHADLDLGGDIGVVELIDVPGSYSLVARSNEEQVAIEALLGLEGAARPELVVLCVDATNLSRNLYLVLQAQELGLNIILALTMVDEAGKAAPDAKELSTLLGCPVIPVIARTGHGVDELMRGMGERLTAQAEPVLRFAPSPRLRAQIDTVRASFPATWPSTDGLALWVLMSVGDGDELILPAPVRSAAQSALVDDATAKALDDECVHGRYAFIDRHISLPEARTDAQQFTRKIDAVMIHPVWGFAVFLLVNLSLFQALFSWSEPAIDAVESAFAWLASTLGALLGDNLFSELITGGVIGGVGAVVVFLPQILLLFFFVGLMEDSGYMARVAYLMDRVMKAMGLHGRAFVPMLSGFACAVPAIMATRTMERQRDRLLTMLVVPLMTCSARLPVYTLIIGALYSPTTKVLGISVQSGLMVALYVFSVVISLLAAFVLSKTMLPTVHGTALILELPPYRIPRLHDVLRMMWQRARAFLTEAGTVILVASIVLWALLNFPRTEHDHSIAVARADSVASQQREVLPELTATDRIQHSYAARLGKAIEPVIAPLGFDWKIGIGLIGAFAAREVFVATMGIVYSVGEDVDETSDGLRDKLREEKRVDGTPAYTPLVGLSLLIFFALACQCVSTLAVVKRETHSYRWPAFLFAYMTALAWLASFAIYQIGRVLGLS